MVVSWLVFNAVNGALSLVDLTVYRDGGLIVRHVSPYYDPHAYAPLYDWGGFSPLALKFTYTPFAAIAFAAVSLLPWVALWIASVAGNMAALVAALWFTFGGLGYRDRRVRLGVTLLAAAVTFWLQPVVRTIYLGQVNLILMAAIMWDLCQPDLRADGRRRWWKGAITGVAAGIKLVPLIFVPYLLITRRFREAAATVVGFLVTIAVGFAVLPHDSSQWWLHGMFMADGNRAGFMGWAGNQSLRAIITRFAGSVAAGQDPWIAAALVALMLGMTAAYLLDRAGYPVPALLGDGADRPARLPDQLGPPLGLDRPRGRGDRALRRRRSPAWRAADRPLAVGAHRRDDLLLWRVAGRDLGERADPRQLLPRLPVGAAQHQPDPVRPAWRPAVVRRVPLARLPAPVGQRLHPRRDGPAADRAVDRVPAQEAARGG